MPLEINKININEIEINSIYPNQSKHSISSNAFMNKNRKINDPINKMLEYCIELSDRFIMLK